MVPHSHVGQVRMWLRQLREKWFSWMLVVLGFVGWLIDSSLWITWDRSMPRLADHTHTFAVQGHTDTFYVGFNDYVLLQALWVVAGLCFGAGTLLLRRSRTS